MKQFEHCKMSKKQILSISLLSICIGLVVFLISVMLFLEGTINPHIIFAYCSVVAALLTGFLVFISKRLEYCISQLKVYMKQASTDQLTELHNRSYLDPFLKNEIDIADRLKNQVSVIMIDMDHFKEINDKHGHIVGDYVLTIFAQLVLKCIRKTDKIARYGGDEFIVVLPCTDTTTAHTIAERIRQEVSSSSVPPIDGVAISSISCSVGISTYPALCDNKSNLIKTSDLALYEAKHSGRNCTIVYSDSLTQAY